MYAATTARTGLDRCCPMIRSDTILKLDRNPSAYRYSPYAELLLVVLASPIFIGAERFTQTYVIF